MTYLTSWKKNNRLIITVTVQHTGEQWEWERKAFFNDAVSFYDYIASVVNNYSKSKGIGGMIQTSENWSTWRKTCLNTTLSTTNPTVICMESNMGTCCERLMTNCLRHGMASRTTQETQVQIIDHKLKTWPLQNHDSKCLNNLAANHRWQMLFMWQNGNI